MMPTRYTLGLDISTQSISAVVLDVDARAVTHQISLAYRDDSRLNGFGIESETLLLPPREPGEADQPPRMFLAGLDAVFSDLRDAGAPLGEIAAIAVSAQQHGHVYLNNRAKTAIHNLQDTASGGTSGGTADLATRFSGVFAYPRAPVWQTANTDHEAAEIRRGVGGKDAVIALSGSDSPLRFTGAVIRRVGRRFPEAYRATARISLLSSFFSAVLSGNPETPIDWGNGSGMSLMDYRNRAWSDELVVVVAEGLPGGTSALRDKLPGLGEPTRIAGLIASYFTGRYGVNPGCLVTIGSGDNPQSKVMTSGDLLSLGSSFVYMVDTSEPAVDVQGYANSMYDGVGRPFVFACRTNGAMVWDRTRAAIDAGAATDFAAADAILEATTPGSTVEIWQPYAESYPASPIIPNQSAGLVRDALTVRSARPELYPAIVDSTLSLIWHFARGFDRNSHGENPDEKRPLSVTGGPARSAPVLSRIAAIWNRPVYTIGDAGAATGSAVSAWKAFCDHTGVAADLDALRLGLLPRSEQIAPDPAIVSLYHGTGGSGGYIERLIARFAELTRN